MPVFLVMTTGRWAIEGDVKKRQFFKRIIAEETLEKEKIEKTWIDDWSISKKSRNTKKTKAWTLVDLNHIDAWVKRAMAGNAPKDAYRSSGTTSLSVLITRTKGVSD